MITAQPELRISKKPHATRCYHYNFDEINCCTTWQGWGNDPANAKPGMDEMSSKPNDDRGF